MPLRRNLRTGRIRRVGRRRYAGVRRSRVGFTKQPIHYFKRSLYQSGAISVIAGTDTFGQTAFTLFSLPGYTEFTNLFDQYKIMKVKMSIIPRGNAVDIQTGATTGQSVSVFSAIDYDDAAPPTSIAQLCEYANMKMTRSTQIHSRTFRPSPQVNVNVAGGGTSPATKGQWLDTALPLVPHWGLKWALQQVPNGTQTYDVKYDFHLAFKNVR